MAELPSGTVTFLLTDVEGSTALWEEAPEAMRAALARHDALFEQAVGEHGGVHIRPRGEGDSRFAVFASAPNAVAAAVATQRAFAAEPWPTPRPIKVRIGLHTGEGELRDGDYYGSAVNRCARLRSIGYGEQVLLSEATTALVRQSMPRNVWLRDLGWHRLKDLTEPERISQVVVPDMTSDFPPVASLDARANNLPTHPTALLGRERELAEVRELFGDGVRLVTLTGPGGTGKTRLGLQVVADLLDDFQHGAFLVDLAPISEPALVPATIAQVLGVRDVGSRPMVDALKEHLREQSLLLLLDNFEQILPAAPAVADLLATCPNLKILVTSRESLRVRGEHEYAVLPLGLPEHLRTTKAEVASHAPAVALFVQRARAIRADFALTDQNAPAVAKICARLDGLPLAIELAAARVRVLTPQAMAARLERRLPLLTGGARDLPTRHQSLRGAIAWSRDLLDDHERRLFRRLSIFVGGWTLEAAEAVCGLADDVVDVADGLESLVAKSLVSRDGDSLGDVRFRMLETIREYALEELEVCCEAPQLRQRHAEHYLMIAEEAAPNLRSSGEQAEWFRRLDVEQNNLRAALAWSQTSSEYAELALRLVGALFWYWVGRGQLSEGRRWLQQAISVGQTAPTAVRIRALSALGNVLRLQGDVSRAVALHEEALALARESNDAWGIAQGLGELGTTAEQQGDFARARVLFEEALQLFRDLDDGPGVAWSLRHLGHVSTASGEYEAATNFYNESLALYRSHDDQVGIAQSFADLGHLSLTQGDLESSARLCEESLTLFRTGGFGGAIGSALALMAELTWRQGDHERAQLLYNDAVRYAWSVGEKRHLATGLAGLASVAAAQRRFRRAARLFGAIEALRGVVGPSRHPRGAGVDQALATVRAALTDGEVSAAWAEGQSMTLEQAVAYALEEPPPA